MSACIRLTLAFKLFFSRFYFISIALVSPWSRRSLRSINFSSFGSSSMLVEVFVLCVSDNHHTIKTIHFLHIHTAQLAKYLNVMAMKLVLEHHSCGIRLKTSAKLVAFLGMVSFPSISSVMFTLLDTFNNFLLDSDRAWIRHCRVRQSPHWSRRFGRGGYRVYAEIGGP